MVDYRLVKIIGVDTDSPVSSEKLLQPTKPLEMADTTQEKFAKARQYQEQGYEAQLKAINAVGQAASKAALARSQNTTGAQIAEIVGNIGAALKVYQHSVALKNKEVEEQNEKVQKQMDKELKAQNEEGQTLAQQYIKTHLLKLFETAGTSASSEGVHATQHQLNRIINQQFGSLPAEMRKELINTAYAGLEEAQKKTTAKKIEGMAELSAAQRDMKKAEIDYLTSALSTRLGTARTVEEQNKTWTDFWKVLEDNTKHLDQVDKLKITSAVLTGAIEQYKGGEQARQRLVEEANSVAKLYEEIQPVIEAYNKGEIGDYEKEARIRVIAQKYGQPGLAGSVPDIYSVTEKAAQYQRNLENIRRMAEDQNSAIDFHDYNESWKYSIGALVYEIMQNTPDARILLAAAKEGKGTLSPLEKTAINTYEDFIKDRNKWNGLVTRYNEYNVQLAKLLDAANRQSFGRTQDEASFLRTIQALRSDLLADPKQVEAAIGALTAARKQAGGKLSESGNEVLRSVDALRSTVLPEMRELIEKWSGVGLDVRDPKNKSFLQKLDAETSAIRESAKNRPRNAPSNRPVLPNF